MKTASALLLLLLQTHESGANILRQENLHAQLHALRLECNRIDAAAAVPSHAEAPTTGNWDQAEALWRAGTETSPPKVLSFSQPESVLLLEGEQGGASTAGLEGRGARVHGFRGASGGVPARGPGVSPDLSPRAPPSPPVFTLPKHCQFAKAERETL